MFDPEKFFSMASGRTLEGIGSGHASMTSGFVPLAGEEQEKAALIDEIGRRFPTVLQEIFADGNAML